MTRSSELVLQPLTEAEENAWRALARAILVIPRALEPELLKSSGLNLAEYSVLMTLSENQDRSMRMSELADVVSLSGSGLTRVVERLSRQELVERVKCETDGRGQLAVLTDAGLARLKEAWPVHLAGVREHVMDHLAGLDLVAFADAVANIAAGEVGPPPRRPVAGYRRIAGSTASTMRSASSLSSGSPLRKSR